MPDPHRHDHDAADARRHHPAAPHAHRHDPDAAHAHRHDPDAAHAHRHDPGAAHDVLAAEEFGMPAPDPGLHRDAAHDVLAAEEFGMPAPDPALHHGPVTLPGDPTGIAEPHDVLAAEEFAMPAGRRDDSVSGSERRTGRRGLGVAAALGLLATFLLRKRRS